MISWSSLNKIAGNQISERQTEENYWQDAEKKDVVNITTLKTLPILNANVY